MDTAIATAAPVSERSRTEDGFLNIATQECPKTLDCNHLQSTDVTFAHQSNGSTNYISGINSFVLIVRRHPC